MSREPALETQCRESERHPERCLNPLCSNPVVPKRKHAPLKHYCCGECCQQASIIKRAAKLSKTLGKWRADLIQDLGGDVSTQQRALVDLAVKSKLLLDSIDAWLLVQPSLINQRKRSLLPVVRERQALADGLARYLAQLGLDRRTKIKTLTDLLNEDDADKEASQ